MPMIVTATLIAAHIQGATYFDGKIRKLSPDGTKLLLQVEDEKGGGVGRLVIDVPTDKITHRWYLDRIVYGTYHYDRQGERTALMWAADSQSFFEVTTAPARRQFVKVREISLAKPEDPIEYADFNIDGPTGLKFWIQGDRVIASTPHIGVRVRFWSWELRDPRITKQWMIQAPIGYRFAGYDYSSGEYWIWNLRVDKSVKNLKRDKWFCASDPYGIQYRAVRYR